ncbi:hypothetical protein cgR_2631 [Corynebacterium glutamicum R]|uniref:Uncharacterized protein n=1 Tax=Corynebacterium glutamicum (strain R) TaxID=340322 RepID=A0AB72VE75_CORGB|nr:hypothetical protein cgR_2631 [Corynebacterium glutamicum R]
MLSRLPGNECYCNLSVEQVSCGAHCGSSGLLRVTAEAHCPGAGNVVAGVDEGDGCFKDVELVEFEDFNATAGVGKQVGACGNWAGCHDVSVGGGALALAVVDQGCVEVEHSSAACLGLEVADAQVAGWCVGVGEGAPFHAACFFAKSAGELVSEACAERIVSVDPWLGLDWLHRVITSLLAAELDDGGVTGVLGTGVERH